MYRYAENNLDIAEEFAVIYGFVSSWKCYIIHNNHPIATCISYSYSMSQNYN